MDNGKHPQAERLSHKRQVRYRAVTITAWTGFLNSQGQIATLWQLVINGSSNTGQIIQGSDVFTYSAKIDQKSLLKGK